LAHYFVENNHLVDMLLVDIVVGMFAAVVNVIDLTVVVVCILRRSSPTQTLVLLRHVVLLQQQLTALLSVVLRHPFSYRKKLDKNPDFFSSIFFSF